MLFVVHAETNKLRLKDLSKEVTQELTGRLECDEVAKEKFYQFFGLKMQGRFLFSDIEKLFPDTTISVLKDCFEALRLYDLAELLEKVRPRSLRPALSPEEIEKLQSPDDRPTKCHNNVAVLIVNHRDKRDSVEVDNDKKIEKFFKDLNSQNEVVIESTISQETRDILWEVTRKKKEEERLRKERERLEKAMKRRKAFEGSGRVYYQRKGPQPTKQEEIWLRQLERYMKEEAKLTEQIASDIKKTKELEKETERAISAAVDKWIQTQGWFTSSASNT